MLPRAGSAGHHPVKETAMKFLKTTVAALGILAAVAVANVLLPPDLAPKQRIEQAFDALVPRAEAQVPGLPNSPYNVDLGTLIVNTARAPATTNTPDQNNIAYVGVMCTFNETA